MMIVESANDLGVNKLINNHVNLRQEKYLNLFLGITFIKSFINLFVPVQRLSSQYQLSRLIRAANWSTPFGFCNLLLRRMDT